MFQQCVLSELLCHFDVILEISHSEKVENFTFDLWWIFKQSFFSAVMHDWTPGQNGTVIDHQTPYQQAFFIINCEITIIIYIKHQQQLHFNYPKSDSKNAYALILLQVCALNNPWSLLLVLWTPGDSHLRMNHSGESGIACSSGIRHPKHNSNTKCL